MAVVRASVATVDARRDDRVIWVIGVNWVIGDSSCSRWSGSVDVRW
jgi:hypothetical protein